MYFLGLFSRYMRGFSWITTPLHLYMAENVYKNLAY